MCGSNKREVEFKDLLVACPEYASGVPLMISAGECKRCRFHLGVELATELRGIKVFDVLCGLPVRRRAQHLVTSVKTDAMDIIVEDAGRPEDADASPK